MSLATINNKLTQINGDLVEPVVSKGPVIRPVVGLIYKTYFDVNINRNGFTNNCKDNPVVNTVAIKPDSTYEEVIIEPSTDGVHNKWYCNLSTKLYGIDVITFANGPFVGKTGLEYGIMATNETKCSLFWNESPYCYHISSNYFAKYRVVQTNCWFKYHGTGKTIGLGLRSAYTTSRDGVKCIRFNISQDYGTIEVTPYSGTTTNTVSSNTSIYVPCSEDEWHQVTMIRTDDRNAYFYLDGNLVFKWYYGDHIYGNHPDQIYYDLNEDLVGCYAGFTTDEYNNGSRFYLTSFSICKSDNSFNDHMNVPTYY